MTAVIAKLATFLGLTMLEALMVCLLLDVFNFVFVVFSLPSLIEIFLFFFSGVCGMLSSWVVFAFIRVEVRLIFKKVGESSAFALEFFSGLSFSGEYLVGLLL